MKKLLIMSLVLLAVGCAKENDDEGVATIDALLVPFKYMRWGDSPEAVAEVLAASDWNLEFHSEADGDYYYMGEKFDYIIHWFGGADEVAFSVTEIVGCRFESGALIEIAYYLPAVFPDPLYDKDSEASPATRKRALVEGLGREFLSAPVSNSGYVRFAAETSNCRVSIQNKKFPDTTPFCTRIRGLFGGQCPASYRRRAEATSGGHLDFFISWKKIA